MGRSYKWQPHNGARHAVPRKLAVNAMDRTLCDIEVTGGSDAWPDEARCWPTCRECDLAWRAHEHILPWPRNERSKMPKLAKTSARAVGAGATSPGGQ